MIELWAGVFGPAFAFIALVALLGFPLASWIRLKQGLLAPASVFIGFAVLSLAIVFLAWAGLFVRWSIIGLFASGAVASAWTLYLRPRASRVSTPEGSVSPRSDKRRIQPHWLFFGAALLLFSLLPLYPVFAFDATTYHLPLAELLIDAQRFTFDPSVRFSYLPQSGEAVFATILMVVGRAQVIQGVSFLLLVTTAWLMIAWFKAYRGDRFGGLISACIFVASPLLLFVATVPHPDFWALASAVAGMMLAQACLESDEPNARGVWLCSGLLLGQAAATKYTGLLVAGLFLASLFLLVRRRVAWFWLLVGLLAIAAPWYVRTWVVAGNPLYPELLWLFGSRNGLWTNAELASYRWAVRGQIASGLRGQLAIVFRDVRFLFGMLPGADTWPTPPLTPLALVAVPGALFRELRSSKAFHAVLVVGLGYLAFWMTVSGDARYALPAFGALALGGGFVASAIRHSFEPMISRPTRSWAAVLIVGAILATSVLHAVLVLNEAGLPKASLSWQRPWLRSRVRCYSGVEYLNQRYGDRFSAYGAGCEEARFFAKGRWIGDYFGAGSYSRVFGPYVDRFAEADPTEFIPNLRELRAEFIVFPRSQLTNTKVLESTNDLRLLHSDYFSAVYRVSASPRGPRKAERLSRSSTHDGAAGIRTSPPR